MNNYLTQITKDLNLKLDVINHPQPLENHKLDVINHSQPLENIEEAFKDYESIQGIKSAHFCCAKVFNFFYCC